MAYVQVNGAGAVVGVFGGPQGAAVAGYQVIADTDPRLAAFLAPPPRPSIIPVPAFWARFTPAEQSAIEAAAATAPAIAQAMTFALLIGQVNLLTGPIVLNWMASLVAAGVITAARSAIILTP